MAHSSRAAAYSPAIREEAVQNATGRAWSEWFALLDQAQAQSWSHAAIARWLATEHGVTAWWSQTVTVEYERARGLRQVHQKASGFAASASKTLALSVDELHRWWAEPPRRRKSQEDLLLAGEGIPI